MDIPERYEIGSLLGEGGFASVYSAYDLVTRKKVALKLIDKKIMRTNKLNDRVRNEVEIHSRLRHPAIIELYDFFETKQFVCLVLELADLGDLGAVLAAKPLPHVEVQAILVQLIGGLDYLHRNGIVHRDIKPANLLVSTEGQVQIADFGLAVHHKKGNHKQEKATFCGTPNFIAPEVVLRQPHGPGSDVWSLGCLLVMLLTGAPPWGRGSMQAVSARILEGNLKLPEDLDPTAADLISRMLDANVDRRITLAGIAKHPYIAPMAPVDLIKSPLPAVDTVRSDCVDTSTASWPVSTAGHQPSWIAPPIPPRSHCMSNATIRMPTLPAGGQPAAAQRLVNTTRLKPAAYTVRGTRLEVLPDSGFLMQLPKASPTHPSRSVTVSPDGCTITVQQCALGIPSDPGVVPDGHERSYSVWDMPTELAGLYTFATEVVGMLRSKTPKVILNTSRARCMLMEDGPTATFDVRFYSGQRVRVGGSEAVLTDDSGNRVATVRRDAVLGSQHCVAGLSESSCELLEHVHEAFAAVRKIEDLHAKALGELGFPVVVGNRNRLAEGGALRVHGPTPTYAAFSQSGEWALLLDTGETWVLRPDGRQMLLSAQADELLSLEPGERPADARFVELSVSPTTVQTPADTVAVAAAADALASITNLSRSNPTKTVQAHLRALSKRLGTRAT